jgi:hypothetical protein
MRHGGRKPIAAPRGKRDDPGETVIRVVLIGHKPLLGERLKGTVQRGPIDANH